jgi:hypothetical protein
MFYLMGSEQQKCKSREILPQFSPKREQTGFIEINISRSIFKLESPGFWHNVLFYEFWATDMQVSRNLSPVLAKTWLNGISRNEHISVNFQARESWFLAKWSIWWVLSTKNASLAKSRSSSLQNVNKRDLKNQHISVNFKARESWFLA